MEISPLPNWNDIAEKVAASRGRVVLIGATDTGKTTLARYLIEQWCQQGIKVALVDGDVGQSTVGLPGTVGMSLFDSADELDDFPRRAKGPDLFFVGSFSPVGHLLQLVVGVKTMVDRAEQLGSEITIVDTTGLVFGGIGAHLKYQKLKLVQPRHIILIQRSGELDNLQRLFSRSGDYEIHLLPVAQGVQKRSQGSRRTYRQQRLQQYFGNAQNLTLDFPEVIFWGRGCFTGIQLGTQDLRFISRILRGTILYGEWGGESLFLVAQNMALRKDLSPLKTKYGVEQVVIAHEKDFFNRLISLEDPKGVLALGIVRGINFVEKRLGVVTPLKEFGQVKILKFGSEVLAEGYA